MEEKMYQQMYYELFTAITDALGYMENRMYPTAANLLRAAQCEAEEIYIGWGEDKREAE